MLYHLRDGVVYLHSGRQWCKWVSLRRLEAAAVRPYNACLLVRPFLWSISTEPFAGESCDAQYPMPRAVLPRVRCEPKSFISMCTRLANLRWPRSFAVLTTACRASVVWVRQDFSSSCPSGWSCPVARCLWKSLLHRSSWVQKS